MMKMRRLGNSSLTVSPIVLGETSSVGPSMSQLPSGYWMRSYLQDSTLSTPQTYTQHGRLGIMGENPKPSSEDGLSKVEGGIKL